MSKCQVKTGMFVLKECGNAAHAKCDDCGVFICSKHGKQDGPKIVCVQCYAKNHAQDFEKPKYKEQTYREWENGSFSNYSQWYFMTRYSFHSSSHYRPFDEDDYSNFDHGSEDEFIDDTDGGSFFDS